MKFYLVDLYEEHDVGEHFDFTERNYSCRATIDTERENVVITPGKHDISSYVKLPDGGCGTRNISWSLACQLYFAVTDEEGTILFTANDYNVDRRLDPDCGFYTKFQEFMDNGWTSDSPAVLLSGEDDFIV